MFAESSSAQLLGLPVWHRQNPCRTAHTTGLLTGQTLEDWQEIQTAVLAYNVLRKLNSSMLNKVAYTLTVLDCMHLAHHELESAVMIII